MAVLPELNSDQILFLQTIFNVFHTKGKWPTYDDVDRIITQKHPTFNMETVSKSLPDGFAAGFGFDRRYDQEAFFIVATNALDAQWFSLTRSSVMGTPVVSICLTARSGHPSPGEAEEVRGASP